MYADGRPRRTTTGNRVGLQSTEFQVQPSSARRSDRSVVDASFAVSLACPFRLRNQQIEVVNDSDVLAITD
jgi:hypothetical protein